MEILVNQEPLDYSLEDESSVGEVIDGLSDWLRSGRYEITSLDVNARTYAIHDRTQWQDIHLDDVRQLSVEALPLSDVNHATVIAVEEYLSILGECLESRTADPLPELAEELPYVRERIAQFIPSLVDEAGRVDALASRELDGGELPSPAEAERLITEIGSLRTILQSREREFRAPARELAISLGQLHATADQLVEVPVQLQTGREAAAMQTVIALTELLARVMRLIPLTEQSRQADAVDVAGVRRFAEDIAPLLAELKEAFEAQDTVLVGDLLEYEIAPRLESLQQLVPGAAADS